MLTNDSPSDLALRSAGLAKTALRQTASHAKRHGTALLYLSSSVLVSVCNMAASFLVVHWITPEDLGLWYSARLALVYSMFALAGVNNGLSRELPYYMGKGDEKMSGKLASTTLTYLSGAALLVLCGGFFAMLWLHSAGEKTLLAIGAVTILIIITFYTNYLIVTFRSVKHFQDLSKVKLAEGIGGVLLLPLVYVVGYGGMLGRVLGISGTVCLLMHWLRPLKVSLRWDRQAFILLLKTGLPIFAMDYLFTSAVTTDRLVLLHFATVKVVGYYALALSVKEAVGVVPRALTEYVYPRMSFSYGQGSDPRRLFKMGLKASSLSLMLMAPVAIAGWFAIPLIVRMWLPKYNEGIFVAQLALIAGVIAGGMVAENALWSMKAWKAMVWYRVVTSAFVVLGPILGAMLYASPLVGVGLGVLAAQILCVPVSWAFAYRVTHRGSLAQNTTEQ